MRTAHPQSAQLRLVTRSRRATAECIDRRGARSDKSPPVNRATHPFKSPTTCERCGAVFLHKAWRRGRDIGVVMRSVWDVCPACDQVDHGVYHGRVLIRGLAGPEREDAVLRRVENVAARARFTQPERRIVAVQRGPEGIEIRTTSQKLAHRIVREIEKAFRGHARLHWSDADGRLFATWDA